MKFEGQFSRFILGPGCTCCIHYLIGVCRASLNLNLTQGRPCLPTKEWNAMFFIQSRARYLHCDTGTERTYFIVLWTNGVYCNHGTHYLGPFQTAWSREPTPHTHLLTIIYIRTLQKSGCWNYLFPKVSQSSCKFTQANGFAPCSWVLHVTYAGRFCCNEKLAPCSGTVLVLVCLVLSLPGPQGAMNKDTRILTCNMGVSRNWEATTPPSLCFLVQKNLL